jgi:hypothetical protein
MFGGYIKDHFLYICTPKNGSTTFSTLLSKHGWQYVDLVDNELDYSKLKLWGHITDPDYRHTKGLAEYLQLNPDIDLTNDSVAKMLVTGIFDGHAASVSMLLGELFYNPTIHWIPLDVKINNYAGDSIVIVTGNDLTNDFFIENNLDIRVTKDDIRNFAIEEDFILREKIVELKKRFHPNSEAKINDFTWLGSYYRFDNILYSRLIEKFFNQYYKKSRTWLN